MTEPVDGNEILRVLVESNAIDLEAIGRVFREHAAEWNLENEVPLAVGGKRGFVQLMQLSGDYVEQIEDLDALGAVSRKDLPSE